MDGSLFDALTRALGSDHPRRGLFHLMVQFVPAASLAQPGANQLMAKRKQKKKRKRKNKKCQYEGQKRCGNRCIGQGLCCTDAECRPRGECAGCMQGSCVADGRICLDVYGPCYSCDQTSMRCVATVDGRECGDCRVCQGGNCVGCRALGECAGCKDGRCIPDGTLCINTHGPCWFCDGVSTPYICRSTSTPCEVAGSTQCCRNEQSCCSFGCTNLNEDTRHCGDCDNSCIGLQFCDRGSCRCPDPLTWCETARACIFAEQTCCGPLVCAEGMRCCGSGDTARCVNGPC